MLAVYARYQEDVGVEITQRNIPVRNVHDQVFVLLDQYANVHSSTYLSVGRKGGFQVDENGNARR